MHAGHTPLLLPLGCPWQPLFGSRTWRTRVQHDAAHTADAQAAAQSAQGLFTHSLRALAPHPTPPFAAAAARARQQPWRGALRSHSVGVAAVCVLGLGLLCASLGWGYCVCVLGLGLLCVSLGCRSTAAPGRDLELTGLCSAVPRGLTPAAPPPPGCSFLGPAVHLCADDCVRADREHLAGPPARGSHHLPGAAHGLVAGGARARWMCGTENNG